MSGSEGTTGQRPKHAGYQVKLEDRAHPARTEKKTKETDHRKGEFKQKSQRPGPERQILLIRGARTGSKEELCLKGREASPEDCQ